MSVQAQIVDLLRDLQKRRGLAYLFISHACVVTFHSIYYLTYPKKSASRRESFRKRSPEFAMVDRIAYAFKHVETGHGKSAHLQPLKAGDVIERPRAVWGEMVWGLSTWGDGIGGVTVKNDHERDLLEIVKGAAEFVRASVKP
jgi:hypothetical protein